MMGDGTMFCDGNVIDATLCGAIPGQSERFKGTEKVLQTLFAVLSDHRTNQNASKVLK